MAEIDVPSAVIGIASVALSLALKLHDFSITTSAAGQQIAFVARNVTNYADALEILGERVNDDDPVHSKRAVKLVNRLCRDSYDIFDQIEAMIPEPKKGRDEISFVQKLAWNFKKGHVEYLAGQIECLKSTTNLLVSVLFAGKRIRARRRQRGKKARDHLVPTDVAREEARVSIAILEQVEAADRLVAMQAKVVEDNSHRALNAPNTLVTADTPHPTIDVAAPRQMDTMTIYQMPVAQDSRSCDRKQLVLQHTQTILQQLLDELTTCNIGEDNDVKEAMPADVVLPESKQEAVNQSHYVSQEPHISATTSQEARPKIGEQFDTYDGVSGRRYISQFRFPLDISRQPQPDKLREDLTRSIPSRVADDIGASRARAKERYKAETAAAAKKPPEGFWNSVMARLTADIDGSQRGPADEKSRSSRPVRSRSSKTSHQRSREPIDNVLERRRKNPRYTDTEETIYGKKIRDSDIAHDRYYDPPRDAMAQLSALNEDEW